MIETTLNEALDLGAWLGRKQAFSGMVGRCSAAEANCLRTIREEKRYKITGLTWEAFCTKHLGISRALADKTIRLLEEFGERYFHLNGVIAIPPEGYRLVAGSGGDEAVQYQGESIPIAAQNAARLGEALDSLKKTARLALPAPASVKKATEKEAGSPHLLTTLLAPPLDRLSRAVTELERYIGNIRSSDPTILDPIRDAATRLNKLEASLRRY